MQFFQELNSYDLSNTSKYNSIRVSVDIPASLLSYVIYTEYKPDYTAIDDKDTLFCFTKDSKEPILLIYCREDPSKKNFSLLDVYSKNDMEEEATLFLSSLFKLLVDYSTRDMPEFKTDLI
ncbi:MAG: hypothetical protein HY831_04380 [Candidatus Aenigmarchaeota archaeon]|nr:hypothetical protein [Candidatus Aenigmarchaeota archaeon]